MLDCHLEVHAYLFAGVKNSKTTLIHSVEIFFAGAILVPYYSRFSSFSPWSLGVHCIFQDCFDWQHPNAYTAMPGNCEQAHCQRWVETHPSLPGREAHFKFVFMRKHVSKPLSTCPKPQTLHPRPWHPVRAAEARACDADRGNQAAGCCREELGVPYTLNIIKITLNPNPRNRNPNTQEPWTQNPN